MTLTKNAKLTDEIGYILRVFHESSCYSVPLDTEISRAVERILALVSSPPVAADRVEAAEQLAEIRAILAGTDMVSLPHDYPTVRMAEDRMRTLNKRTLEGLALVGKLEAADRASEARLPDELRDLSERATAGPWVATGTAAGWGGVRSDYWSIEVCRMVETHPANAPFIAAAANFVRMRASVFDAPTED